MEKFLGQRLLDEKLVTEDQLRKALERQRLHGGRLGHNLVALGFIIKAEDLNLFFKRYLKVPDDVRATGLELSFISDLIMKHILFMGEFTMKDVSDKIKLPISVVDSAIQVLRRERFVEVKGAAEYARVTYNFSITGQGRNRALELLDVCSYIGPAPVTLDDYKKMVEIQTVKNIIVDEKTVKNAFSRFIISEDLLIRLGPAISSGKAIFIYGPPGNGKTAIAETIGRILPETVYMPYAIIVEGQIINVFDPVNHVSVKPEKDDFDQRWVLVKRPIIMTGGELGLSMLDLEFNPISNFCNASLQMKVNNGLFIVCV